MKRENFFTAEGIAYYTLFAFITVIKLFYFVEYLIIEYAETTLIRKDFPASPQITLHLLFMVFAAAVYHKSPVQLFAQYYAHKLMRKSHIRKRKP